MPTRLRPSCRALLTVVLVRLNFYSAGLQAYLPARSGPETDGRTDGRTPDRCIDSAPPHATRTASKISGKPGGRIWRQRQPAGQYAAACRSSERRRRCHGVPRHEAPTPENSRRTWWIATRPARGTAPSGWPPDALRPSTRSLLPQTQRQVYTVI